ncbi:twin-arginine translocation signal domain-containing protein [Microbulbifer taiwanensis]|uniref:twin-arginine translocation signal domain-containing protein n=1 Tax=Microbulbifer taiwanensis TaxID=986746 RepID=UPI00361D9376
MEGFRQDRRNFIKLCTVAGITLFAAPSLWQLGRARQAGSSTGKLNWRGDGPDPAFRSDGIAKVTGQKIFGRDYRARDMSDWPQQQHYALALRCNRVERRFTGIDWTQVPADSQPYARITAQSLVDRKLKLPPFYGEAMLLPEGQSPYYYGHVVAMLLFDDFEKYAIAKQALQFNERIIRYGEETPPVERDPYASWRIIRVEGKGGPTGEDLYSPLQDGLFFPSIAIAKPSGRRSRTRPAMSASGVSTTRDRFAIRWSGSLRPATGTWCVASTKPRSSTR